MDKPLAALEITSKSIKLVVGYEIDGQVYVLYSLTQPIGHIVDAGSFLDYQTVVEEVKKLREISDSSARMRINISGVLLLLPPYGLEIFQTQQVTTIVSEEGRIGNIDIRNIYALIRKSRIPVNNDLIDIVPDSFVLDQGRTFQNPPIGQTSNTLMVSAKVHTLPHSIYSSYTDSCNAAEIGIKRTFVAPFAASELLGSYEDLPQDYILVDIGAYTTTVSLIGQKQLFASTFFTWGGDVITKKIAENFNISETEAEKYKILYGLDNRKLPFHAPICIVKDEEGGQRKYYAEDLSNIIHEELGVFSSKLNASIDSLLEGYDISYKGLPMLLIGGASQLNGLKEYLEPKVPSEFVRVVYPRSMGVRDPSMFNCLGAILCHAKYQNVYDETHPKVNQVTRNPK